MKLHNNITLSSNDILSSTMLWCLAFNSPIFVININEWELAPSCREEQWWPEAQPHHYIDWFQTPLLDLWKKSPACHNSSGTTIMPQQWEGWICGAPNRENTQEKACKHAMPPCWCPDPVFLCCECKPGILHSLLSSPIPEQSHHPVQWAVHPQPQDRVAIRSMLHPWHQSFAPVHAPYPAPG